MGGNGISSRSASVSSVPPGTWRNIGSKLNSPVVIVMVFRMERAGDANGVRWDMGVKNTTL